MKCIHLHSNSQHWCLFVYHHRLQPLAPVGELPNGHRRLAAVHVAPAGEGSRTGQARCAALRCPLQQRADALLLPRAEPEHAQPPAAALWLLLLLPAAAAGREVSREVERRARATARGPRGRGEVRGLLECIDGWGRSSLVGEFGVLGGRMGIPRGLGVRRRSSWVGGEVCGRTAGHVAHSCGVRCSGALLLLVRARGGCSGGRLAGRGRLREARRGRMQQRPVGWAGGQAGWRWGSHRCRNTPSGQQHITAQRRRTCHDRHG
jgi:hypothetical protein